MATASTRVRRKRAARKEAILDAGLRIVAEDGLAALTVGRLAEELDLTPGALYRYFPGKSAVIAEIERHAIDDIRARLLAALAAFDDRTMAAPVRERALARILFAADFYVGLLDDAPEQVGLLSAMMGDPRRLVPDDELPRVAPAFFGLVFAVDGLFTEAVATGALEPGLARPRTMTFWSALLGVMQMDKLARLDARTFDPRALAPALARTMLRGWGADKAALAAAQRLIEETEA